MPTHITSHDVIDLHSFIIGDRRRIETPDVREYIESELAPSINEHGLAQAILLERHEPRNGTNIFGLDISSEHTLVAGWCRTQAFKYLKLEAIPYSYKAELPLHEKKAIELEENFRRKAMTWQEEVLAISEIHLLKKASNPDTRWGVRQTGRMLGVNYGYVSECCTWAKLLLAKDPAVQACASVTEVKKLLSQRKEDEIQKELQKRQKSGRKEVVAPLIGLKRKNIYQGAIPSLDTHSSSGLDTALGSPNERIRIDLSEALFHEDCRDFFNRCPAESIDLVVTDIPFGIDMADLQDLDGVTRIEGEHDVNENLEQMPEFLKGAFKVLKDRSYLFFWYDLCHHEKLQQWAIEAGFTVQRWPLIWLKEHGGKNKAAHCWFTKNIEYVMVCRKGPATLAAPEHQCYFSCSGYAERRMQSNPFAKPFAFTQWMLKNVLVPGMTVLDCYAGGGSIVRALLNLGANVLAVEKKEIHFNELTQHVQNFYKQKHNGNVEFV